MLSPEAGCQAQTAGPDVDLVRHAQAAPARDTRAFEELVQRHQAFVVANCRFITRSAADADDLAQEVFVKAFFGLKRFEARSQFKTWLSRIKVNQCLNHLRRRHGQAVDVDDESIAAEPALQVSAVATHDLEAADRQAAIAATLDELSNALRVPLILADADGLPYDETRPSSASGSRP